MGFVQTDSGVRFVLREWTTDLERVRVALRHVRRLAERFAKASSMRGVGEALPEGYRSPPRMTTRRKERADNEERYRLRDMREHRATRLAVEAGIAFVGFGLVLVAAAAWSSC
jgi:hypothetical protein